MMQPKDYADGWDPYKTDPMHVQQLREEGIDSPRYPDDRSDDSQEHEVPQRASHDRPERVIRKRAPELSEFTHETSMSKLFDLLIPPQNDNPENIRRWRISVGLALLILFGHVTLACGWYQDLGFSGFAYASTVKDIKVGLLEQRLFDTRVNQCEAKTVESVRFYGQKVVELLREYHKETQTAYPLPSCRELGRGQIDEDA